METTPKSLTKKVGLAAKWLAGELGLGWRTLEFSGGEDGEDQDPAVLAEHGANELAKLAGTTDESERHAWRRIVQAHQTRGEGLERVRVLTEGLARMGRSVPPQLLQGLMVVLQDSSADAAFLAACQTYPDQSGDDTFLLDLARLAHEPESAGAAIALSAVLENRGRPRLEPRFLVGLLGGMPDRVAVKRYESTLTLLENHRIQVDVGDPLVLGLQDGYPDWLKMATTELTSLKMPIDRLALVRLKEWAPDRDRLDRYFRAMRALTEAGLSPADGEKLILPRLEDESRIAVLCQVGRLGKDLGTFSLESAEDLLDRLPDPQSAHRCSQAQSLLAGHSGLSIRDIEALAPEFATSFEDVQWLETYVARARVDTNLLDRLQIMRVHERCPELPQLDRFLKINMHREPFSDSAKPLITSIALEASLSKEATERVAKLLEQAESEGLAGSVTQEDLMTRYSPIRKFILKVQGPLP